MDAFAKCHPLVNLGYLGVAIGSGMLFWHPSASLVCLIVGAAYSIRLNGGAGVRLGLAMVPLIIVATLFNPIFSHGGVTILWYAFTGNPITLESIVFGLAAGVALAGVLLWFSAHNKVMTSDKLVYLFGRIVPALSLVLAMALRFVPRFKAQLRVISGAQRCLGAPRGGWFAKARRGVRVVSILITWALENAIETADSMRSRGYGLRGRTAYSIFRLDRRDKRLLALLAGCLVLIGVGVVRGAMAMKFYPMLIVPEWSPLTVASHLALAVVCLTPLALTLREDVWWRYSRSRI